MLVAGQSAFADDFGDTHASAFAGVGVAIETIADAVRHPASAANCSIFTGGNLLDKSSRWQAGQEVSKLALSGRWLCSASRCVSPFLAICFAGSAPKFIDTMEPFIKR